MAKSKPTLVRSLLAKAVNSAGNARMTRRGFVKLVGTSGFAVSVADDLYNDPEDAWLPDSMKMAFYAYGALFVDIAQISKAASVLKHQDKKAITHIMSKIPADGIRLLKDKFGKVKPWSAVAAAEAIHHLPKLSNLGARMRASYASLKQAYHVVFDKATREWRVFSKSSSKEIMILKDGKELFFHRDYAKLVEGTVLVGGTALGAAILTGEDDTLADFGSGLLMTWADTVANEAVADLDYSSALSSAKWQHIMSDPQFYINKLMRAGADLEQAEEIVRTHIRDRLYEGVGPGHEDVGLVDFAVETAEAVKQMVVEEVEEQVDRVTDLRDEAINDAKDTINKMASGVGIGPVFDTQSSVSPARQNDGVSAQILGD